MLVFSKPGDIEMIFHVLGRGWHLNRKQPISNQWLVIIIYVGFRSFVIVQAKYDYTRLDFHDKFEFSRLTNLFSFLLSLQQYNDFGVDPHLFHPFRFYSALERHHYCAHGTWNAFMCWQCWPGHHKVFLDVRHAFVVQDTWSLCRF